MTDDGCSAAIAAIDRGDWDALEASGMFSRAWLDEMRRRDGVMTSTAHPPGVEPWMPYPRTLGGVEITPEAAHRAAQAMAAAIDAEWQALLSSRPSVAPWVPTIRLPSVVHAIALEGL